LHKVRETIGVPILSDVHCREEVASASRVLDVVQIPAYLCMQTQLTLAVAKQAKVVNVKKGQFLAPEDMKHIVEKIEACGNTNILLTERGTCFGYHDLIVDIRSLPRLRRLGYPVAFDVTHAIRVYGRPSSDPSGGRPEFVPHLARAAVAAGCDAIFIETHPCVDEALCDAASMWPLDSLEALLIQLKAIDHAVRNG
jgi:2-dehydro-3-deoxyphosphooctonate aldolase (KDO 8-P synthase)